MSELITKRLEDFSTLHDGWSYGEGVAFAPETLAHAKELTEQIEELGLDCDVFPGLHGQVVVEIYVATEIDVDVEPDGTYSIWNGADFVDGLSLKAVHERIVTEKNLGV